MPTHDNAPSAPLGTIRTAEPFSDPELNNARWQAGTTPAADPAPAERTTSRKTRRLRITRTGVNFWLDVCLALLLLTQLWITFVLRFAFPPGPEAAGWSLWSWSYEAWFRAYFGTACVLASAVVLHVMLHWSWVCGVVSRWFRRPGSPKPQTDDPVRTLVGVMLLIGILVVMGIGLAAAIFTVVGPE